MSAVFPSAVAQPCTATAQASSQSKPRPLSHWQVWGQAPRMLRPGQSEVQRPPHPCGLIPLFWKLPEGRSSGWVAPWAAARSSWKGSLLAEELRSGAEVSLLDGRDLGEPGLLPDGPPWARGMHSLTVLQGLGAHRKAAPREPCFHQFIFFCEHIFICIWLQKTNALEFVASGSIQRWSGGPC